MSAAWPVPCSPPTAIPDKQARRRVTGRVHRPSPPNSVSRSLGVTVARRCVYRQPLHRQPSRAPQREEPARAIPRLVCLLSCGAGQAATWDWRFPCQVPPAAAGAARAAVLARVPAPAPAAATAAVAVAAGVPAAVPLVPAAPDPSARVLRALGVHGTDLRASGDDSQPGPCLPRRPLSSPGSARSIRGNPAGLSRRIGAGAQLLLGPSGRGGRGCSRAHFS